VGYHFHDVRLFFCSPLFKRIEEMAQTIFPLANQIAMAGLIRTPYITGKARLFKAVIPFTPNIAAADLTAIEADFDGYAAVTFTTCGAVYVDPAGGASFDLARAAFVDTGTTTPNDIYGGWVEDSGGLLLFAWQVTTPYPMTATLDAMNLDMVVNLFGPRGVVIVNNGIPL
jgi:hypothetical protein